MSATFRMPDLGEGLEEAEIVSWHVGPGDHVVADQPLLSVETDKAVVEVPSPQSGTVARLHGAAGDMVKVGAPLVEFAAEAVADTGAIVGDLGPQARGSAPPRTGTGARRPAAAPAVRALAKERGVDLAGLAGSGPGGAITRADVEAAGEGGEGEGGEGEDGAGGFEPLRGPRRAMARNMARAGRETVPATVTDVADIDAWWAPEADVTMRLVRALVRAAAAEPALNAWYDGTRQARHTHDRVDIGIAIDTSDGLFVPVLRDCSRRDAATLRAALDRLVAAVRARTIAADALKGATVTLSNFGAIGGRHAVLVVMPPQVAIVGAGRVLPTLPADAADERGSVADERTGGGSKGDGRIGGSIRVHRGLPLSLTFDHRAVTGGEAARFLAALVADLERAA